MKAPSSTTISARLVLCMRLLLLKGEIMATTIWVGARSKPVKNQLTLPTRLLYPFLCQDALQSNFSSNVFLRFVQHLIYLKYFRSFDCTNELVLLS